MKSKDLQNIVLSKYQKGDTPTEIHPHLNGGISLATIKAWYPMIRRSATRGTCRSKHTQGTNENTQKVKTYLHRKQKISARKLSSELEISATSVRRILKIDLGYKSYKNKIQSSVSDDQKVEWKQFSVASNKFLEKKTP